MTIADYLNAYSYRVIPQDAVQYPWKSQAFVYLDGHYRMGAQVFLAFSSSIFGVTTDRAYMPVTALMLAISFLTLSGFLRSMAASLAATLAALSLYFTNVYYI